MINQSRVVKNNGSMLCLKLFTDVAMDQIILYLTQIISPTQTSTFST